MPLAGQRDLMATHRATVAEREQERDPHDTPAGRHGEGARRTGGRERRLVGATETRQAQSSNGSPAWTLPPSGHQDGEQVGIGLQGDDRADRRQAGRRARRAATR